MQQPRCSREHPTPLPHPQLSEKKAEQCDFSCWKSDPRAMMRYFPMTPKICPTFPVNNQGRDARSTADAETSGQAGPTRTELRAHSVTGYRPAQEGQDKGERRHTKYIFISLNKIIWTL